MKITSSDYKYQHLGTVYRLVEQFELISRTDLAKLSGFAPASMTVLTKILIDHKLILERTSQNLPSRGRPAVGLSISPFHWRYLCLTLAPQKLSIALCDLSGTLIYQQHYSLTSDEYLSLDQHILHCIQTFSLNTPLTNEALLAISISVVGKIDRTKTIITQLGQQPLSCPLVETLHSHFNQPILLNEHFQLWLLAEATLGSLIANDNVIFLQLDDQVNLSVLLKGALLHQDEHKRMNVDKMIMPKFSTLSDEIAEQRTEIERYQLTNQVTFPALANLIDRYFDHQHTCLEDKINYFCEQVEAENPQAMQILSHLTDNLAYMLMNLINIFSTEKIMLNSSLLRIKKPLFEQLQTKLQQNLLLNELRIDIVTSQYDWDSPLIPSIAIKLGIYEGCLLKGIVEI
ncbi:ROK family protein [Glaesserella parasuis]|uniref:ROK family protein n=1 Tax=Glaesserella parasuis TaxID=738 RepID=UPI0005518E5C|nr:ROK family protein [Glaesserella parasuis]MCT8547032.1 ROK family protein [Glaesserella parasuis]MCT8551282.1 ROK family protein [Glaesserella parasuis]MCT8592691.1 ROK family protein [Glaesserella parasuis]MCT8847091.1 ROK family protein [Glaesserella parasuis]MCT8849031.1 ROK family protein [Glaesserella parasuis]